MLAGLDAAHLAARGIDVEVLAEQTVASELAVGSVRVISANEPRRIPGVRSALRLATPFGYRSGAAPHGALSDRDVVHYPLGFMAAPRISVATVVTAVDLQHLYHPDFFSRRERLIRARTWHPAIRRASRVAVYSEIVKESIVDRLGMSAERIDVVHACCDQRFYRRAEGSDQRGRYLLYPASPLPNKNHARLLRAFKQARRSHPDLTLILVGPLTHDWSSVRTAQIALGLEESVEIRGHVSVDELVDLYRGALALIFPSLFEGFGIPVLEAMAAGCPLVVADIPSIREICGTSAVLFDPEDEDSIRDGITSVAGASPRTLDTMVARATQWAEEFRPDRHVDLLLNCLCQAVSEMRPT